MVLDGGHGEGLDGRVGSGCGGGFDDSPSNAARMNKSRDAHGQQATAGRVTCLSRFGVPDTGRVSEQLNAIPPAHRRRMALALAPLGGVLLVAGIVAAFRDGIGWRLAGLLVAGLALVLLGIAWGLRRSAALSEAAAAERQLDEVLAAAAGGGVCGSSGLACGSGSADGGCGAACLTRRADTRTQ
jgi:hypothetical protein